MPLELTMLLIMMLLFLIDPTNSFPTINYTKWDCFNSSNYSFQSPFESNIELLLSNLVSQISMAPNRFFTHKQWSFANDEYQAYGLALCHGDIKPDDCRRCVEVASKEVVTSCPRAAKAVLWKDDCMLRYSDQPFFSLLQEQPQKSLYNIDNVTDHVDDWTKLIHVTLNEVTSKAASNESSNKFATKEAWFSPMNKYLYTLAQCTPDLTKENCTKCFREASSRLLVSRRGGVVLTPSCTIRYEIFRFYELHSPQQSSLIHESLAPPPMNASRGKKKRSITNLVLLIVGPLAVIGMLIFLGSCLFKLIARNDDFRTLVVHFRNPVEDNITDDGSAKTKSHQYPCFEANTVLEDLTAESLMFKLETLEVATNNFSHEQKLGQGGFGTVYQGALPNGQPIAVKRLSRISCQGVEEFKNEVLVIAKLQHRNLVRLLGFCLAGEEKLLVYEFVPNKSLNYFLFDAQNKGKLNWQIRYNIIKGVARGLVYLHEDSQPRIIHRDLKPGNILLDGNMNPKISDFGSARIFKIEQSEDATSRVVGTYGYMAPEYAMHGLFSTNSDVYSFGILVLEIISGKNISSNFRLSQEEDLLTSAWRCLAEEKPLEFIDLTYTDSCSSAEVMKCIHLGLLCAQDNINERPTMSAVVQILNSDSTTLMTPPCPRSFYCTSTDTSTVSKLSRYYTTTSSTNVSLPLSQSQEIIKETHPR